MRRAVKNQLLEIIEWAESIWDQDTMLPQHRARCVPQNAICSLINSDHHNVSHNALLFTKYFQTIWQPFDKNSQFCIVKENREGHNLFFENLPISIRPYLSRSKKSWEKIIIKFVWPSQKPSTVAYLEADPSKTY